MKLDVFVGLASRDTWSSDFGMCMIQLVADFAQKYEGFDEQRIRVDKKEGSILPNQREGLAQKALELGCTHLLFIDTDQTFPPSALRRMLSWKEPIVACNVAIKTFPTAPTARLFTKGNTKGGLLFTWSDSVGLAPVWRIGTGIMLIDTKVLRKIPEPWFPNRWMEETKTFQGEDWCFCEKAEAYGFHPVVDQALSWQVGHVGKMEYKHDLIPDPMDWGEARPEDGTVMSHNMVPSTKAKESDARPS